jgi:hypothetical protein
VAVPRQLQLVWAELVGLVERGPGAELLVDRLMEKVAEGGEAGLLAGAWVVLLVEGLLGAGGSKLLPVTPRRVTESRLARWLERPGPVVGQLAGLLCRAAGLPEERRRRVEQLVKAAAAAPESPAGPGVVRTLGELRGEEGPGGKEGGWRVASGQCWDTVPLGGWQGQDWGALWGEGEWDEEEGEGAETLPTFAVGAIDWSSASGPAGRRAGEGRGQTVLKELPHFYTAGAKPQQRSPWKRQKRN